MGEKQTKPFQLSFNGLLKVDFQGSHVTSDGGLILVLARHHQTVPADLLIKHVERVPIVFARPHHGVDGAAEQPYQPSGLRLAGRPRAVLAVPRPREQPARQTLEQGDRRIGQRRCQLPHLCGQRSEPPPLAEVAEQVARSDRSLACELGSSGRVDVVAEMAR